jgi:hypothetical protein
MAFLGAFWREFGTFWRFLALCVSVTPLFGGGAKVFSVEVVCFQRKQKVECVFVGRGRNALNFNALWRIGGKAGSSRWVGDRACF